MAKKQARGARGLRGPAGPSGARGARGERGQRGAQGARGTKGRAGAFGSNAKPKDLIKVLDMQVEGIYRELNVQMRRMSRVQQQLDEVRAAIKRLAAQES